MTVREDERRLARTPTRAPEVELTILMPCLNEAETIQVCVRKALGFLERAKITGEVLISDNGSTDGSQALAESEGARVVGVLDRGYGAALIGGIRAARGRYIIMGDADDSYDFERLDLMLAKLREGSQLVMFGALARRYAMVEGFLPPPKTFKPFLLGLTLEIILRAALVVFLAGLVGAGWAVERWAELGFGPIQFYGVMRLLVVSLTAVAVSVQLAASGFLASVFTIRR